MVDSCRVVVISDAPIIGSTIVSAVKLGIRYRLKASIPIEKQSCVFAHAHYAFDLDLTHAQHAAENQDGTFLQSLAMLFATSAIHLWLII